MATLPDRIAYQALMDNRNILIVDDEEPIRRLLGYLLQSHGYTVALAGDAREARQKLDQQPYALMLCDVNMPGESGMDLVRDILRERPTPLPSWSQVSIVPFWPMRHWTWAPLDTSSSRLNPTKS